MKLLETLLCTKGEIRHLPYHQDRVDKAFKELFGAAKAHTLYDHLDLPLEGTFRVRVVYDASSIEISYQPYSPVYQKDFILLEADFSYPYKFLDRHHFDTLKTKYPHQEIIFYKDGLITDTTIANIACFIEGQWLTPAKPLLEGTTRARLLETKVLIPASITLEAFRNAPKFALMNALTDFYEVKNATIADPII